MVKKLVESSKKSQQAYACACAVGSRDKSVSVWLTSLKRPLVVIQDLFAAPVLDITWSSSGLSLMACSLDGTVAYFEFTEKELGKAMSLEDKVCTKMLLLSYFMLFLLFQLLSHSLKSAYML